MKKSFEYALEHNEIVPFFKGEGDYFSHDRMGWDDHDSAVNWMYMCDYLKCQTKPFDLLVNVFKIYLNSLNEELLDSWGLLDNLRAYYSIRFRHEYFFNDHDDLIAKLDNCEKIKIERLFRLLRDNFDTLQREKCLLPFDNLFNFLKENGCEYDFFH